LAKIGLIFLAECIDEIAVRRKHLEFHKGNKMRYEDLLQLELLRFTSKIRRQSQSVDGYILAVHLVQCKNVSKLTFLLLLGKKKIVIFFFIFCFKDRSSADRRT